MASETPEEGSSACVQAPRKARTITSCNRCRRLKKVCRGNAPCQRCVAASQECVYERPSGPVLPPGSEDLLAVLQGIEAQLKVLTSITAGSQERLLKVEEALAHAVNDSNASAEIDALHAPYTAPNSPRLSVVGNGDHATHSSGIGEIPDHKLHLHAQALVDAAASMPDWHLGIADHHNLPSSSKVEPDIISKGIFTQLQAYACFREYVTEMHEFCSVIHPQVDTFESIRQNSSFLFHTIIYLGARALPAAQGDMLQVATEEARCSWKKALIDETPTLQTVQALTINACWHDNAYITSGIAMRMALHMRWHLLTHRYDRDAWSSNNENMRPRICQLRTWLIVQFLDFKHSISTDRPLQSQERENARMAQTADYLLLSPFCTADDIRCVANLQMCLKIRTFMKVAREKRPAWAVEKFIETSKAEIEVWHAHYDAMLVARGHAPDSWPRLSHRRHLYDGCLQLTTMLYQQDLLRLDDERCARARTYAFECAQGSIRTVLSSASYSSSIRHSGYSTRVDLTFACLLLMKLFKVDPRYPQADMLRDVTAIADLLRDTPGSRRYEELLRFSLLRWGEPPVPPAQLGAPIPWSSDTQMGETLAASADPDLSWLALDSWLSALNENPYAAPDFTKLPSFPDDGSFQSVWPYPRDLTLQ